MKIYKIDANSDASRDQSSDSGWLDVSWLVDDISFEIMGTWSNFSVALDVSNEPYQKGVTRSKFTTVGTYGVADGPFGLPRNIGGRIRFRRVDSGSPTGAAYVGISPGRNALGQLIAISPEPTGAP